MKKAPDQAMTEFRKVREATIATLVAQRGEIDEQLAEIGYLEAVTSGASSRKARACSTCGDPTHNARHHGSSDTAAQPANT